MRTAKRLVPPPTHVLQKQILALLLPSTIVKLLKIILAKLRTKIVMWWRNLNI
jgi:hypothetical protein